jgi:AraC-like DNA-binding protein
MTESQNAFDWSNFTHFMNAAIGAPAEQIEALESPYGTAYLCRSETPPFVGRFTFFSFDNEMRAIIVDGVAEEETLFNLVDGDWVRFNFALMIDISMDDIQQVPVQLSSPSWRIIDHPRDKITREVVPKGSVAKWLTIVCKHSKIQKLSGRELDDLPEFFRFVDASQDRSTQYRDFVLRSRFASITTDVLRSEIADPLNIAYLEARCTELLCLALEDLIDPIDIDGLPALNTADRERVEKAKLYIDENFKHGLTVKQISSAAGMNRNSLFYGFKKKFGVSVSEYIQSLKLEKAKHLIQHSDKHLIEIAEDVGFKHQTSFITAFKKRFGTTPGKLRRQI